MKSFPRASWRLIKDLPARGSWNMAIDEAISETTSIGEELPTLRLYAWKPACLSLGYAQPVAHVDFTSLEQLGWECVRRPTGGRAILHTDELTYSVAGPQDEPRLAGSVLESYANLALALLSALRLLNIQAVANPEKLIHTGSHSQGAVCFETPSNYEITVQSRKLIGSAQARRKGSVLQHGSLPLGGDLARITQVLVFPKQEDRHQAANRLLQHACTVEMILGSFLNWQTAANTFAKAFQEALNLELKLGELSKAEIERAEELEHQKYASREWTWRV